MGRLQIGKRCLQGGDALPDRPAFQQQEGPFQPRTGSLDAVQHLQRGLAHPAAEEPRRQRGRQFVQLGGVRKLVPERAQRRHRGLGVLGDHLDAQLLRPRRPPLGRAMTIRFRDPPSGGEGGSRIGHRHRGTRQPLVVGAGLRGIVDQLHEPPVGPQGASLPVQVFRLAREALQEAASLGVVQTLPGRSCEGLCFHLQILAQREFGAGFKPGNGGGFVPQRGDDDGSRDGPLRSQIRDAPEDLTVPRAIASQRARPCIGSVLGAPGRHMHIPELDQKHGRVVERNQAFLEQLGGPPRPKHLHVGHGTLAVRIGGAGLGEYPRRDRSLQRFPRAGLGEHLHPESPNRARLGIDPQVDIDHGQDLGDAPAGPEHPFQPENGRGRRRMQTQQLAQRRLGVLQVPPCLLGGRLPEHAVFQPGVGTRLTRGSAGCTEHQCRGPEQRRRTLHGRPHHRPPSPAGGAVRFRRSK